MNKIVVITSAVVGVILAIAGAVVLWGVMPGAIRNKVAEEMRIVNDTKNEAYERFEKLPVPLRWSIRVFNVTNPELFNGPNYIENLTQIVYKEVGPYVYEEQRDKHSIEFDKDGNVVSYEEKKNYTFRPDLSGKGLKETDMVTIVHLGLGLPMEHLQNPFIGGMVTAFTLTDTVENIGFKGVEKLFKQNLFNCTSCDGTTKKVFTGKKDINQIGNLIDYGFSENSTGKFWDNTKHNKTGHCNDITGTDGTQFHPDVKESDTLTVYETMLCRTIKFKKELDNVDAKGISTLRFVASDANFAHSEENKCFCYEEDEKDCPGGILNLKYCPPADMFHVDILASNPFFLSNQALLPESGIEGLAAKKDLTKENYGTIVDVEPYTGLVLRARKRVQLNVLLKKGSHKFVSKLSKNKMIAPLMWIEEAGDVDDKNADTLKDKIFGPKRMLTGFMIALMALGVLLVAVAGGCAYFKR